MTLIIDALKTAQIERSERATPKNDLQMLEGFFPFVDGAKRQAKSNRRGLVIGVVAAAGLVMVGGAWTYTRLHHSAGTAIRPLAPHVVLPPATVQAAGIAAAAPAKQSKADSVAHAAANAKVAAVAPAPVRSAGAGEVQTTHAAGSPSFAHVLVTDSGSHKGASANTEAVPAPRASAPQSSTSNGVVLEGPQTRPVDLRISQGADAMGRGDYASANEIFKSAQSMGGGGRELFYDWAITRQQLGDLDGAGVEFNHALALDPTYVDAMVGAAHVMELQGNRPGEIAQLGKAVQVEPGNVHARLAYANLFENVGDFSSARQQFQAAVAADNTNAIAHYDLAAVSLTLADTAAAVKEFRLAARLAPSDPSMPAAQRSDVVTKANAWLKKLPGGATP